MEFVKKTYKPKDEKVKKLTTYMTQLKTINKVKCELFTKATIILVMLTGCSAEYHLKKAIKKDPSIIKPTIHVIDTIILTDSVAITDTFVSKTIDTMVVEKDGVKTIVYRNHDVIRIQTVVKPDTIRIQKTITIPQVQYKERVKIPQSIGIGIGLVLLLVLLLALLKRWATGTIQIIRITPKTGGKHHQGHPRKAVEHGRVCARIKTHIPKSVVMALYGRKVLAVSIVIHNN